ncbi:MBL fold metallo-hydrolase [Mucilaginibacter sp.]|uniref:MBL fold metallo-hydrolase n=1 Tax=Mucilaginibacter sp. TaxID=1882438 RepID=UPI000CBEA5B6|nr:MBL fold metallo-hydrolase [Mucilaginibacter sp.]PLW91089.1 MAG: MBL fold metallo-hydrolase [Mucilaginibacter sp.]HEK19534.1 MBL fold metallo-hydrolase [Bacteroidota bacterium]
MKIEQFEDKGLSHYSYAILSECENEVVLIDPSRDIAPYLAFAEQHQAKIIGVVETHPHADFVSGHLELHLSVGATIYCSQFVGAAYPHQTFDDGDTISLGNIKLKALNTPGHSPDSICIVLELDGKDKAVFTGDTMFIGDCGRPDLRENTGNLTAKREELANQMYHSLRDKLMTLADDVLVYPAHGAGTLCGKALSEANSSTIGAEKLSNWSLQKMREDEFTKMLLQDQPFVPKYFSYNVGLNKQGASGLIASLKSVPHGTSGKLNKTILVIDSRPEHTYKRSHLPGSINLQNGAKFETWLGSIVAPGEAFYLTADSDSELEELVLRCAKIGYEVFIEQTFVGNDGTEMMETLDVEDFKADSNRYVIVDIRNPSEVKTHPIFANAITIPLPELRERILEIPFNKPIVVHCAGGYRSAAGSSIIQSVYGTKTKVFDLGEAIKGFL